MTSRIEDLRTAGVNPLRKLFLPILAVLASSGCATTNVRPQAPTIEVSDEDEQKRQGLELVASWQWLSNDGCERNTPADLRTCDQVRAITVAAMRYRLIRTGAEAEQAARRYQNELARLEPAATLHLLRAITTTFEAPGHGDIPVAAQEEVADIVRTIFNRRNRIVDRFDANRTRSVDITSNDSAMLSAYIRQLYSEGKDIGDQRAADLLQQLSQRSMTFAGARALFEICTRTILTSNGRGMATLAYKFAEAAIAIENNFPNTLPRAQ